MPAFSEVQVARLQKHALLLRCKTRPLDKMPFPCGPLKQACVSPPSRCSAAAEPVTPGSFSECAHHQKFHAAVAEAEELLNGPFHAFPTLQQLAAATEEDLRAMGFGYRCDARPLIWKLEQQDVHRNPFHAVCTYTLLSTAGREPARA